MAERQLRGLISDILDDSKNDGFNQSDRNLTDTLVAFNGIDDILYTWYVNQYHYTQSKRKRAPGTKQKASAQAVVDQDWKGLIRVRRGAFAAYVKAAKKAVKSNGYGVQLSSIPSQFVWRFYPWNSRKHSAEHAHQVVNQVAMGAMADYVDSKWKPAEKKLRGKSYINNSAHGPGSQRGSLASMATNFAHGRYAGQSSPGSEEYGSTTGSVAILEDIVLGDLRKEFERANPVVDEFIDDIFDMFITEGNIEIVDASSIGGHKNTIIIKGAVTSKRINASTMKSWDRDKTGQSGIQKRIADTLQGTFDKLMGDIETKGSIVGYNFEDISASPTQTEIVLDKGVRKVLGEIKKTNPKAKITFAKKKIKQKKRTTAKGSSKKGKGGRTRSKKRPSKKIAPARVKVGGKTRARASAAMNPIGLQQLLNKALPEELMKNMGPYPRRLENRTGRFARSAQVTQVVPMPKSVEIRYDYLKDPYAVFEPENGNAMASTGRDPKMLIGGTIRELAQSIMGTKYGLVRTKRV